MKKAIFILIVCIYSFSGIAQETKDDNKNKSEKKFGANNTHYVHSYLNIGFMMPLTEGEGADILYGKSHTFTYGARYKFKIADFFALGTGINYTYKVWHLSQVDTKVVPGDMMYDKEKIRTNNLGGDVFIRFNIGKRDNTIGNYIDLGAYGEYAYAISREVTINANDPNNPLGSEYITVTYFHLNYLEKLNYGLQARLGYGKFVLFGKYRMSNLFTDNFKTAISTSEFPRLIIGLEMGMHK
ncbi:MAG: PorT family protein [Bacteroidales bacterium]|nr:PorT family protein [Bacteroidales bacterium]